LKSYLNYARLFIIAVIVVLADQWTKQLVRANLQFGEVLTPSSWLSPHIQIVHWRNTGALMSILEDKTVLFMLLSITILLVILFFYPRIPKEDWASRLALGLLLGGTMGNMVDRMTLGYVTDFIALLNLVVLNIADISIWLGTAILLFTALFRDKKEPHDPSEEVLEDEEFDPLLSSDNPEI
jgi:signal peptidase II